jgi:hypothetical protein
MALAQSALEIATMEKAHGKGSLTGKNREDNISN